MAENELVKMSPKGQLVVPQEIREKEGFRAGDRFIPFQIKEVIIIYKYGASTCQVCPVDYQNP